LALGRRGELENERDSDVGEACERRVGDGEKTDGWICRGGCAGGAIDGQEDVSPGDSERWIMRRLLHDWSKVSTSRGAISEGSTNIRPWLGSEMASSFSLCTVCSTRRGRGAIIWIGAASSTAYRLD